MSDSDGDFSDELLELAGAGEKKRRKRQAHTSAKRKRQSLSGSESDSPNEAPESEAVDSNPYPLEGKYVDEEDRERLLGMSEIERENILAQRQDEMQRIQDKRNLDQMVRERTGGGEESVSKAAKRQHAPRGATKEKSRKLDELKARRRAKDDKKRTRTDSPKRDRSSSPMDMGSSEDEEEDGQISRFEEEEDHDRRHTGKSSTDDEPITLEELNLVRVTRDMIEKYCFLPWFESYIKGAWVRYLVGQDNNMPVYRACEVVEVSTDISHPYKVNTQLVDHELKLKHGASEKKFPMDKISNSPFTDREFDRLVRVSETDKMKIPTKGMLKKKELQMVKLADSPLTEADISAMIARKGQINAKTKRGGLTGAHFVVEKTRLLKARSLAVGRNDTAEIEELDAKIALLGDVDNRPARKEEEGDVIAKVNERNRKANMEAIRRAEQLESERKRRERRLAAHANGTATPPADRLRSRALDSRPGTPFLKTALGTPRSISPLPPSKTDIIKSSDQEGGFEASVIDSVEIDLGDF